MPDKIHKYQSLVNKTIPITRYMQWSIDELDQEGITSTTVLKPNINVHGTGFAGSVYAAAMATGWTLLKYWYDENEFEIKFSHKSTLLAAEANIKYLAPVIGDFSCSAKIDKGNQAYVKLITRLENKISCALPLEVEVLCNSKVCAILNVHFVFKS